MGALQDTSTASELTAGSPLLAEALELASQAHEGQERKGGGAPYVSHPIAVAKILSDAGYDEDVVAALLHDVVEDSPTGAEEIADRFGRRVGELVAAMTEDEAILSFGERKDEHRRRIEEAGPDAAAIYAADKLVNARDTRRAHAEIGERAAGRTPLDRRMETWRADEAAAAALLGDDELVRALRTELDAFEAQRARDGA
jgi:(p)ppGpp synthase/HD superfamily hydrolase